MRAMRAKSSTLRSRRKSLVSNKRLKRCSRRLELVEPMDVDEDYQSTSIEPMDIDFEYDSQPQNTQNQLNPQFRHNVEIAVSIAIVLHY